MNTVKTVAVTGVALATLGGCDRSNSDAPDATKDATAMIAQNAATPVPTALDGTSLARLTPARPTLIAVAVDGAAYVVQQPESDGASNDVLRIANGAATPTKLTASAVFDALNLNAGGATQKNAQSPTIVGRFASLAARADGKLVFAFTGVNDKLPFFALGTFDPATGTIFAPVDHLTIGNGGDADIATDTAKLNLFVSGDDAWLWRATGSEMRLISISRLSDVSPAISTKRVALDQVRDETTNEAERSGWEWSATPAAGNFLLTDTAKRWIRRIDAAGAVTHVARFEADSVATLSAAAQDAAGRVIVFAADRDGVARSLLVQNGAMFKAIPTTAFTVAAPATADRLQVDRLIPVPKTPNAYVAYDHASGAVLRITLK